MALLCSAHRTTFFAFTLIAISACGSSTTQSDASVPEDANASIDSAHIDGSNVDDASADVAIDLFVDDDAEIALDMPSDTSVDSLADASTAFDMNGDASLEDDADIAFDMSDDLVSHDDAAFVLDSAIGDASTFEVTPDAAADAALPTPTLTSITPDYGVTAGGATVTIVGTHLSDTTAVNFGDTPGTSLAIVSDTQVTVVTPAMTEGLVEVTASNGTTVSNAISFTYGAPPTLTSLSPNVARSSGGAMVVATGAHFAGATAVQFGSVSASFEIDSDSQITAFAPPGAGSVNVTVTTAFGTSEGLAFGYGDAPTLTSLSPAFGLLDGGASVIVTGTNLFGATAVKFGDVDATEFIVNSDTEIEVISPMHVEGEVNVTVLTAYGTSNGVAFVYDSPPILDTIAPITGASDGGQTITLTGVNFIGATSVLFGEVEATSFTVDSDSQISVVTPAHAVGETNVVVTTPFGTSEPSTFTFGLTPTVYTMWPMTGSMLGGAHVDIGGMNFTGATAVYFGSTPAASFTIDWDGYIIAIAPPGTAGTVHVTIVTPFATSGVYSATEFTYGPPPTVTHISTTTGSGVGGTSITITGTNFASAQSVNFGTVANTTLTVDSDTQLTVLSAPHAVGVVHVTVTTAYGTSEPSEVDEFTYTPGPRIIYMTNSRFQSGSGFSGADELCNADSNKPGAFATGYTYKALLNGNNATTTGVDYYRSDGTTFIATATGGNLVGSASLSNSVSATGGNAWTGASGDCTSWTVATGGTVGRYGDGTSTASTWWNRGNSFCNASQKLYCVSQ